MQFKVSIAASLSANLSSLLSLLLPMLRPFPVTQSTMRQRPMPFTGQQWPVQVIFMQVEFQFNFNSQATVFATLQLCNDINYSGTAYLFVSLFRVRLTHSLGKCTNHFVLNAFHFRYGAFVQSILKRSMDVYICLCKIFTQFWGWWDWPKSTPGIFIGVCTPTDHQYWEWRYTTTIKWWKDGMRRAVEPRPSGVERREESKCGVSLCCAKQSPYARSSLSKLILHPDRNLCWCALRVQRRRFER